MMGPFLGPKKLTTLTNNINNNKLNKKISFLQGTPDTLQTKSTFTP